MKSYAGALLKSDGVNESYEVKRMRNFLPLELRKGSKTHLDGPLRRQIEYHELVCRRSIIGLKKFLRKLVSFQVKKAGLN